MTSLERIILASASPRRRELLAQAGIACEVRVSHVPERPFPKEEPGAYCTRLAREKAQGVRESHANETKGAAIVAADTIVVSPDGDILEKPRDPAHAHEMLAMLSGHTHRVLTGLCVVDGNTGDVLASECVGTRVVFRTLGEDEKNAYVASGEPFDKAGGYGIQGRAAGFVRAVEGSYTNVVGLPLAETVEASASRRATRVRVRTFTARGVGIPMNEADERLAAVKQLVSESARAAGRSAKGHPCAGGVEDAWGRSHRRDARGRPAPRSEKITRRSSCRNTTTPGSPHCPASSGISLGTCKVTKRAMWR